MTTWTRVNNGWMHAKTRAIVGKRTSGNPNRTGDWFCSYSGFGMTQEVGVALAKSFPASGVKTLAQAKQIVESVA